MSNLPSSREQFTDKQVSAILRRAAELQSGRGDAGGQSGASAGFSLQQLQQAAAELGIDPRCIEEAAAELESVRPSEGRSSFWGGPSLVVVERIVDGSITEEDWPDRKSTRLNSSHEWISYAVF